MNKLMTIDAPELEGVEVSKAKKIKETFLPMSKMLAEFEEAYNEILSAKEITPELVSKAKRLRIDIGKVRIETGKIKDKQKEYIKLEDRAIMGVHNILVWAVKEKEDKLKEIENHFERQILKELEELQANRVKAISPYLADAHERDLSGMDNDVWKAYFNTKKQEHLDLIAAEKKAEEERIAKAKAEEAEQKRIRKENEALRAEREAKQAADKLESEKREKIEAEARKVQEAREKAHEKAQAILAEEVAKAKRLLQEEREKAEKELEEKAKAEQAKIDEAKRAEQERLSKGDKGEKQALELALDKMKYTYSFKSAKNKKMYKDVGLLLDKVIDHINK
jgi:colicin import membrane protein